MPAAVVAHTAALTVVLGALVSCGGSDSEASDTSSSTAAAVVLDVTIADGVVRPSGERLEAQTGQDIEVRVDSDAADMLHIHSSPEHEYAIERGDQVFTFSIDTPGVVAVETHETETVVAEIVVS
jgi:hypothetical protein